MHYKPGCRSNSKFGIIVSVTTTLYAALANRYHNKLFFCAGFPSFSKNAEKCLTKHPPGRPGGSVLGDHLGAEGAEPAEKCVK